MSTYAQEMKKKYGVPFDPTKLSSAKGFRYGQKVRQDSEGEAYLSGIPYGAEGKVTALPTGRGYNISDPMKRLIYVDWGRHGIMGVSAKALTKIRK